MKILIIRFSSLGDIVLTEPVVRFLSNRYPDCTIDYVTKPQYRQLVSYFQGINKIIAEEKLSDVIKQVRREKYNLVIDLHRKLNSILVSMFSRAHRKVKYNKKRLLRKQIVAKKRGSIGSTVALYLSAFDKIEEAKLYDKENINIGEEFYPKLILSESPLNKADSQKMESYFEKIAAAKNDGKVAVAIFPGALHKTKQYPTENFTKLIDILPPETYSFFVLGSASEKGLGEEIKKGLVNWCGAFSLDELVTIMERFDLIITNDSGPMHIAAALGKKQVALFGATSAKLGFKPHNKNAVVLEEEIECRPCSLHGGEECHEKHFRCMKELKPERIAKAIEDIIL